ncbi:hypothetical protein [Amycolatopsis sp. VC5-11]|uniref:hypothetical protein n=1 Tax=Amycolatopsis sp. VC5-11 TaxID=3120156 RepID=UPI00300BEF83
MCCILAAELPYVISCAGGDASARRIAAAVDRSLRHRNRDDILAWDRRFPAEERAARWRSAVCMVREFLQELDGLEQLTARPPETVIDRALAAPATQIGAAG